MADYQGRTYDVCAFRGQQAEGEILLMQSLVADGGAICTGVVKAAQRFVLGFLNERGSRPYDPAWGCDFTTRLRHGYLRHESDVFAAFALAAAEILDMLADADEVASPPDDERLTAATLMGVALRPGQCQLRIALATAAGTARAVILPIATS
jgi:hypothetical protein